MSAPHRASKRQMRVSPVRAPDTPLLVGVLCSLASVLLGRFNRREIKEMADADMSRKGHQMREKGRVAMVQVCAPVLPARRLACSLACSLARVFVGAALKVPQAPAAP